MAGETQVNARRHIFVDRDFEVEEVSLGVLAEQTVMLQDQRDGEAVVLSREGAIEVAKRILIRFDVPFCNRVEGAGVEQSV
jgi:hypothetical protein